MKPFNIALAALALLLSSGLQAYVTSATLEYSVDHYARIYLNGHLIDANTGEHYPDYAVLSSSDGSLPLEAFVLNGENVLAMEDIDTDETSPHLAISYRLTVHQSSGDPVVVWGVPEETKLLHLSSGQKEPAGWYQPAFDDSAWQQGVKMVYGNIWYTYPELPDPAFGIFGFQGVVPHISYIANGAAVSGDVDLCRNRFTFPYNPGKVRLLINPPTARTGQAVAMRLIPAGDAADIGAFSLYADIPQGLEVISAPGAASYDREHGRVAWNYESAQRNVRFLTLSAETVVSGGGWGQPELVLGGFKPNHPTGWYHPNIADDLYMEGATFYPGMEASFKMQEPDLPTARNFPQILGVIFHSQMLSGGTNTSIVKDVDDMILNYSVAPDGVKALKKGVWVSRVGSSKAWYDGYYDATEDRHWSWEDIQNLKLYISANTRRNPDQNRVASVWAVVKCFRPEDTAPIFYVRVSDPRCDTLSIQAGLYSRRFASAASDPTTLQVNSQLCAVPTPVPTVALSLPAEVKPQAASGGRVMHGEDILGLGCLDSSPEPFSYGGVFIKFCLKKTATVVLRVYAAGSSSVIREIPAGDFRAGDSQIFFNGLDSDNKPLQPGTYTYELQASNPIAKTLRQGSMSRAEKKQE